MNANDKVHILFMCVANSARSQLAETIGTDLPRKAWALFPLPAAAAR